MQADAIARELNRIGDIQMFMAIAMFILALFALALAGAALFAMMRLRRAMERGIESLPNKTDPVVAAVTRVAENAREVSETAKVRARDMLDSLEEVTERLKAGADSVEDRIKRFGVVVDVVQEEAEKLMLDAASAARGVHTASETLREKRRARLASPVDDDLDEDGFDT